MLTSIHIQGFKGFRDTKIPELRRVNLILGGQNSGKTSLLEAVYAGDVMPSSNGTEFNKLAEVLRVVNGDRLIQKVRKANFRAIPAQREADWIISSGYSKVTQIKITSDELHNYISCFSTLPVSESSLVSLYDIAVHGKTKIKLVKLLQLIESRLNALESIAPKGENAPCLHADLESFQTLIPLSQLGQGFNRLAYLYAGLLGQNANVALIDEIENGIHYSALPVLWQGIANIAHELDIQIFATTHSKECIRAASDAFMGSPDDFQVIRLVRKDDNVEAHTIPADYVQASLNTHGELR
jgi:AAA15 family ATPase/GTPase